MLSINELKGVRAIGYNIAGLLKQKNMPVEELAASLSCPKIHVQAILKGSAELEDEELTAIAHCLGVQTSDLLKEPDEGIENYNVHYMGKPSGVSDMNALLDEVDLYVRLLNT